MHTIQAGGTIWLPCILQRQTIAPVDLHAVVVALDSVESGGQDQDVKFVELPVGRSNPLWLNLCDRRLFQVHDVNIWSIELLEIFLAILCITIT